MAYTPCSSAVTKNIAANCASPIVGGYTGRAVLIPVGDATFTISNTNDHIVTAITMVTVGETTKKAIAVNNVFAEPFTGSNTASGVDTGRFLHTKTLAMRVPLRGGDMSKNIIEALEQSPLGFVALLEKKDKSEGAFELVGLQQGLKVNGDGVSRDEAANGGDTSVTMSCAEPFFEVEYNAGTYATSLAAFEALYTTGAM